MAKKVQYESLLEQLHREYGESYQTTFRNDRASFGLPPKMKPMTKGAQVAFNNPVGGRTEPTNIPEGTPRPFVPTQPESPFAYSQPTSGYSTTQSNSQGQFAYTQPVSWNAPNTQEKYADENAQLQVKPSSTIQSAAYWTNRKYLVVSFKSGHTYSYDGVPLETILAWEQAGSAGSFFYYNIRMNFSYSKLG